MFASIAPRYDAAMTIRCLRELARVVRPGGRVLVLEFGQPRGAFGALYRIYSRVAMPRRSRHRQSRYQYLPRTAAAFPSAGKFVELMDEAACFASVEATPLTGGTAFVYTGVVLDRSGVRHL